MEKSVMDTSRSFFRFILNQEANLTVPAFEKKMLEIETDIFDHHERLPNGMYLAIDGHATARYNQRALMCLPEEDIKNQPFYKGCDRWTAGYLANNVRELLLSDGVLQRLMAEEIFVALEGDDTVVSSREDGASIVILSAKESRVKYVVTYSYTTIFILTVLNKEMPVSDWPTIAAIIEV